ncbi:hypothetical protein AZH52_01440 [Proteus mirabilis]|nr:hypothetical protein AZH52_01440 [Proteus mirabilis]
MWLYKIKVRSINLILFKIMDDSSELHDIASENNIFIIVSEGIITLTWFPFTNNKQLDAISCIFILYPFKLLFFLSISRSFMSIFSMS